MKAFQCSICEHLAMNDVDDTVFCQHGLQPMPHLRDKSDKEECLKVFKPLPKEKHWHEKFHWE